jgi:hypothetical protein
VTLPDAPALPLAPPPAVALAPAAPLLAVPAWVAGELDELLHAEAASAVAASSTPTA